MVRRFFGLSAVLAIGMLVSAAAQAHPAFMVAGESVGPIEKIMSSGVLFEHDGIKVLKRRTAKTADFDKLYWINIDGSIMRSKDLEVYGEVLHLEDKKFAIMKLANIDQVNDLSHILHHAGMACGAVFRLKGDVLQQKRRSPDPVIGTSETVAAVQSAIAMVDQTNIRATVERLAAIDTRYYNTSTGIGVAEMLIGMYSPYAEGRDDVELTTYEHTSLPQPSLMVRIRGTERPDEVIVLGSHIDSVNSREGSRMRAPGADDNASGTATNLEIFRVLMEQGIRPIRTIEIHGYAAEEIGLDGSQDIAAQYARDNIDVIAMVQHDMNLYSRDNVDRIWFVDNNTSSELNNNLMGLLNNYLTVPYRQGTLYGGNSDHYSWTRQGYHAAFPFENPGAYNRSIHTRNDTIANAPRFSQAAEFAKLGVAYLMHYGGVASK